MESPCYGFPNLQILALHQPTSFMIYSRVSESVKRFVCHEVKHFLLLTMFKYN